MELRIVKRKDETFEVQRNSPLRGWEQHMNSRLAKSFKTIEDARESINKYHSWLEQQEAHRKEDVDVVEIITINEEDKEVKEDKIGAYCFKGGTTSSAVVFRDGDRELTFRDTKDDSHKNNIIILLSAILIVLVTVAFFFK